MLGNGVGEGPGDCEGGIRRTDVLASTTEGITVPFTEIGSMVTNGRTYIINYHLFRF